MQDKKLKHKTPHTFTPESLGGGRSLFYGGMLYTPLKGARRED